MKQRFSLRDADLMISGNYNFTVHVFDDFICVSQVKVNDKLGKIEETTNSFRSTFNENLQATSDIPFFRVRMF